MVTKAWRIALAVALTVSVNVAGYLVLVHNLGNGVYPTDADSLGIPLIENAMSSMVVIALMVGSIICSRWNAAVNAVGIVMGLLACGLAALLGLQWLEPNHYIMAAAFGALAATAAALMYVSCRREPVS